MIPMQSLITDHLTVIISFNGKSEKIERAVRSVLNQKITPTFIIIVDAGSDNDDSQRVKKIAESYPFISIVTQDHKGSATAKNRGALESITKYIAFLEADDEWLPEHTSNLVKVISKNNDADFYCTPYIVNSPMGKLKPHVELPESFNGILSNFVKTFSSGYGLIHTSSICFRRSFFLKVGGFPESVHNEKDIYLWLRCGLEGSCAAYNSRSVLVHKDIINNKHHSQNIAPYHVSYFVEHLEDYSATEKKDIKEFLKKNLFLLWAKAKIEKNKHLRFVLRVYVFKLSKMQWFILLFSELIPARFFELVRKRRIANWFGIRLNNLNKNIICLSLLL